MKRWKIIYPNKTNGVRRALFSSFSLSLSLVLPIAIAIIECIGAVELICPLNFCNKFQNQIEIEVFRFKFINLKHSAHNIKTMQNRLAS